MKHKSRMLMRAIMAALAMGLSAGACGFLGFDGTSWKEEVLLHDGSKIVVKRSQTYRGRHEIGQAVPVGEHTIEFELPDSGKSYRWTSKYGEDLGRTEFNLLALHVSRGTPYLIAEPNLCLAYNKHGRPNPPYIIFKYDGKAWQRIQIGELPKEFETINLIVNNGREEEIARLARARGYVPAADIARMNVPLTQPQYSSILRKPLAEKKDGCTRMIRIKSGWEGLGFFRSKGSLDACLSYCQDQAVAKQECPCNELFEGTK
jgi:hypothetical protein